MTRRHSLPAEVYALVEHTPATVLLECAKPDNNTATSEESCTRLFTAPVCVCLANTPAEIPSLFAEIESAVAAGHTAAGFFTYECGACFEPRAGMRPSHTDQPLAWFAIYDRSYRFDHTTGTFRDGSPPDLENFIKPEAAYDPSTSDSGLVKRDSVFTPDDPLSPGAPFIPQLFAGWVGKYEPRSSPEGSTEAIFALTEAEYTQRIAAIHEWIRAGDVYQLNFTAPYRLRMQGGIAALYAQLRARQPVEYGAFIHWQPGRHILSYSPELFFRLEEENGRRHITTRPMKGTAARGRTTREDRDQADWLRNDPKNRAENVMIVDLLRNDLGRLAEFGSVRTESLFAVERHPTLWQMTSTVTAALRSEVGFHDIFRALFPCGSITGAPKVRAMQLLAQLEEQPRGVYTGAIGFFSPQRTVFNVAIRTLDLDGDQGKMGVGSGIVIDSTAAEEYRECLLKAEFLTQHMCASPHHLARPGKLQLIEAMLWDGNYPLIDLHLDRLTDSAEYFAFPCDRGAVRAALEAYAQTFAGTAPRKVRLLLDAKGETQIMSEILPRSSDRYRIGRVRIAKQRTNSADKWLYHKTTQRALYALAYKEATQAGYEDVLFLNERDEVTEGAISNIFIEKAGRLLTPPIGCGLLPGVHRRHLLETHPNIEERVLLLEDLRHADTVYISNAVRALRPVEIDWQG